MIQIRGLKLKPGENEKRLKTISAGKLHLPTERIEELRILKKSLDARRKDAIVWLYTVAVQLNGEDENAVVEAARSKDITVYTEPTYEVPVLENDKNLPRPVIAGFGPAGMFAALVLARAGARPIVLERGQDALTRKAAIDAFHAGGALDPECNVQFGEGGAGTFSDGKLNTGTNDPRLHWVMKMFAEHGAEPSVQWDAKPHVGTDVLVNVVQNFRREVIALGGEVRFGTKMNRLVIQDGVLTGVEALHNGETTVLPCDALILAIGHSARDTFETLYEQQVPMQPKAFSMGVRIEHRQKDINAVQYGQAAKGLPPADYSLNVHLPDGTSTYTFCMCPGGYVFGAASEIGGVVTNGMSYSGRAGENANSALLVTLHPEDFPDSSTLAGMYWQRSIEQAAYHYGGDNYCAPAQKVGDFLNGKPSTGAGKVKPMYQPGVVWGDLHDVLPERITGVLKNALPELGKKLRGFDSPDAVMTAPETRSSSPVRIIRNENLMSEIGGLYPCGEGAGYAGGISSAAVDGMRCAEAVLKDMKAK